MITLLTDILKEFFYKPLFGESFLLVKYYSLKKTAEKLLKSRDLYSRKKGVDFLFTLGFNYPQFRQEILNSIAKAFREDQFNKSIEFNHKKIRFKKSYIHFNLQKTFINALTSIKRDGENGYPYLIDINRSAFYSEKSLKPQNYSENEKIPLEDLRYTNFKDFYMPRCFFMNINLNGSSFENADIGGCVFYNCSIEHCNFKNAKLCGSLFNESIVKDQDENNICFIKTRMFGANLHEAQFKACKIKFHPEENPDEIISNFKSKMPQLQIKTINDMFLLKNN